MTNDIPVFILAGGLGTRIKEETEFRPKPMVPVGEFPIIYHIMKKYHKHGFYKFIVCTGFRSEYIKSYFLNFAKLSSDFTVNLANDGLVVHSSSHNLNWEVTLTFTGELNMTGSRIAQAAEKFLGEYDNFAVTYGDGLTDANLAEEYQFHLNHKRIGTVLGVNPPSRFGELAVNDDLVTSFNEKPKFKNDWINGGYFFFKRDFLKYIKKDVDCILEKEPLIKLTDDRELKMYAHPGFWGCMDTQRDREFLTNLYNSGNAPWA